MQGNIVTVPGIRTWTSLKRDPEVGSAAKCTGELLNGNY